jgi:hypothetical protein
MVFVFGFVTGIGLSLTVLSVMFFHGAAKLNQAVDFEDALVWQKAESMSLTWRIDVPQNESASSRIDTAASATAFNLEAKIIRSTSSTLWQCP